MFYSKISFLKNKGIHRNKRETILMKTLSLSTRDIICYDDATIALRCDYDDRRDGRAGMRGKFCFICVRST